ncbi:MAG TPA: phage tail protein [Chthoniobacteraceae bacterium]|nr:phage tail protein [Chthoniobacteraceae bacterium]
MNKLTLTTIGEAKLAAAVASGEKLMLSQLAIGSASSELLTPESTTIGPELFRFAVTGQSTDGNRVVIEGTISEDHGPFTIRCVGLFDNLGALIGYAGVPETVKPGMMDGFGVSMRVRVYLAFTTVEEVMSIEIVSTVAWADEQAARSGEASNLVMSPLHTWSAVEAQSLINGAAYGVTRLTEEIGVSVVGYGSLDKVPTVGKSTALWSVADSEHGWGIWELVEGSNAASPGAVVRPSDFDLSDNAKVWIRRS